MLTRASAIESAPTFAADARRAVEQRPWTWFALFAAAHAAIWIILPSASYPNLPLDLIEALTYGPEWQLGYDKLPPLPWWLVELANRAAGRDLAYYALAQLSVIAAFAGVWALVLRLAGAAAALTAILIIDGLHYFNFTAPKFNHDVVQLPFWALAGLAFHRALRTGRTGYWAVLGAALGLAFWAKYFVVILGLPLAVFMLVDARARRSFATPGPYVALAVALATMAPHLVWLVGHDFLPFQYAEARARPVAGLAGRLTAPALFAAGQLFWLLPALAISLPLFSRPRDPQGRAGCVQLEPPPARFSLILRMIFVRKVCNLSGSCVSTADDYDRRILALLAFGPAATLIAASAVSGRELVSMWGYPLWLYFGAWLVVAVGSRIDRTCLRQVIGVWGAVTALYALSFFLHWDVLPRFDRQYRAELFPGDRLAAEISDRFHAATSRRLHYVVGSMWLGGNIGHYGADHPRTLIDGDPARAPWIDVADLRRNGAAVVWVGDADNMPAQYASVAGRAVMQAPLTFPMRLGKRVMSIGWAIIPPQ